MKSYQHAVVRFPSLSNLYVELLEMSRTPFYISLKSVWQCIVLLGLEQR